MLIMRVLCKLVINKRWDWMGLDGTGWGLDNGIKCGISNLGRLSNKSIGGYYECMDSQGSRCLLCEIQS